MKISLVNRLVAMVATALVALLLVAGVSAWGGYLVSLQGPSAQRLDRTKDLMADVLPPPGFIVEAFLVVREATLETNPTLRQEVIKQVDALAEDYSRFKTKWAQSLPASDLEAVFTPTVPPAEQFFTLWREQAKKLLVENNLIGARKVVQGDMRPLYLQHAAANRVFVTRLEDHHRLLDAETGRLMQRLVMGTAAAVLAAVLVVVVLAALLVRRIRQLIQANVAALGRMSDGATLLDADTGTELDPMARAMNDTVTRMRQLAQDLTARAGEVRRCADGLAEDSERMAATATELSAQGEQAAASTSLVSQRLQEASAGTTALVQAIGSIAEASGAITTLAQESATIAGSSDQVVTRLEQAGREVAEVAALIASVAAQTNLLALNATIEAARAGDAGRGFAVVANEVKALARQTGQATEDIRARIAAIQSGAHDASTALHRIAEAVAAIATRQQAVDRAVQEQQRSSTQTGRMVVEAAESVAQIAESAHHVAQGANICAEVAERSRRTTGQLTTLAEGLQKAV